MAANADVNPIAARRLEDLCSPPGRPSAQLVQGAMIERACVACGG
jgi:hypothetical protein